MLSCTLDKHIHSLLFRLYCHFRQYSAQRPRNVSSRLTERPRFQRLVLQTVEETMRDVNKLVESVRWVKPHIWWLTLPKVCHNQAQVFRPVQAAEWTCKFTTKHTVRTSEYLFAKIDNPILKANAKLWANSYWTKSLDCDSCLLKKDRRCKKYCWAIRDRFLLWWKPYWSNLYAFVYGRCQR
jgi:hypothetical protein